MASYHDLRDWIEAIEARGELIRIPGADPSGESGAIVSADIKNCRLIELRPPAHRPAVALGSPARGCVHHPPQAWGSPNGAFPLTHGRYLVTDRIG